MNSNIKNTRLLSALNCETVDKTPVWMMRQAGRHLPEYRAIRKLVPNFMDLCRNPDLCAEVTMQPIRRYGFDAAILFSDILTIPDAMGLGLNFVSEKGPVFDKKILTKKDALNLAVPDMADDLGYVADAVKAIKKSLDNEIPLIGFSGSPWTLATYMVEGQGSKQFLNIRKMMFQQSETLKIILETTTKSVIDYLQSQIDAGVDVVMIFDSWGGILGEDTYEEFSLNYMKKIVNAISFKNPNIPIILFTKGGMLWIDKMATSKSSALGIDWTISLKKARKIVGNNICLQGNLDPSALYASDEDLEKYIKSCFHGIKSKNGFIFNLGHGISPDVQPEKVSLMVDLVRKYG